MLYERPRRDRLLRFLGFINGRQFLKPLHRTATGAAVADRWFRHLFPSQFSQLVNKHSQVGMPLLGSISKMCV